MANIVNNITIKDIKVVNVPNAYNVGVVTFVVIPKISSGRVFFTPDVISVRANSSYDKVKPNNATPIKEGVTNGKTTYLNVCQFVAPRSFDASS